MPRSGSTGFAAGRSQSYGWACNERSVPHTCVVSSRRVRLLVARVFLVGFVCFVAGIAVEFTSSTAVGTALILLGGAAMAGSRFAAGRLRLPAP
ncbi:MAG: hypothetical protein JWP07_2839 [Pseudonocardiales bacterium]|jgi:hypothetical protein|nr:hypothetical protein [Pseudonocardiales bacterium]